MSGSVCLFTVGFIIEFAGLIIAADGFRKTWNEFATDQKFLAPVVERVRGGLNAVQSAVRKLLRRPKKPAVVHGAAKAGSSLIAKARGSKAYGPLPSIEENPSGFADVVQIRLDELLRDMQAGYRRLSDDILTAERRVRDELDRLDDGVVRVEAAVRSVAIGGLREQAVGWLLVLLGFSLQGIAQFIQSA